MKRSVVLCGLAWPGTELLVVVDVECGSRER